MGSCAAGKLSALLVLVVLLSPFVVAFWAMGIMAPQNLKDWVVLGFYTIVLVATVFILLLYMYARLKHRICESC